MDRNLNLILGLIWTMILRYQVSEAGEGDDGGARKALLEWLRSIGINANDLTNEYRITKISILISISWVDGKKILNLINKIPSRNLRLQ